MELVETGRTQDESYTAISYDITNGTHTVGWATVMVDEEYAYLERIDIDDSHQGAGVGTAAVSALSSMYGSIVAAPDNEGSQKLFDRLGDDVSSKYWAVDQGFGVYEV